MMLSRDVGPILTGIVRCQACGDVSAVVVPMAALGYFPCPFCDHVSPAMIGAWFVASPYAQAANRALYLEHDIAEALHRAIRC